MNDHKTCRACGATLGVIDCETEVTCPICGIWNQVATDHEIAISEIEAAADMRVKLTAVRSLVSRPEALTVSAWTVRQIREILE